MLPTPRQPEPTPIDTPRAEWSRGRDGLASLRGEWNALAADCARDSVFHGHAWAVAWAEAHSAWDLEVLVLRAERPLAILAWVRWPGRLLGLPVRRYALLGGIPTGTTQRSRAAALLCRDLRWGWGATTPLLVARAGQRRWLEQALRESARALRPDLLHLQGLEPELAPDGAFVTSREPNWVAPSGGLETGRGRLSKRSKKRLASGLESLQGRAGFDWSVVPGARLSAPDLAELEALERKSRKAAAGASILTSGPTNRAFLAGLLAHEPACRVGRMRVEGRLIAWALGLRAGRRGEGLLLAHDPDFDDFYPGLLAYLLVEEAMVAEETSAEETSAEETGAEESAAEATGTPPLESYSFGRGAEWWKTDRLLARPEPRVDVTIFGQSVRGALLRSLHARAAARRDHRRGNHLASDAPKQRDPAPIERAS